MSKVVHGILYLSRTRAVLILYRAGCFWLDLQGMIQNSIQNAFPPSGRLRRSFLPPQCSREGSGAGLQVAYRVETTSEVCP